MTISFLKKLKKQLQDEYHTDIDVINNKVSLFNIIDIIKKSNIDHKITIITKEAYKDLVQKNNYNIFIVIYDGKGVECDKNINVKFLFKEDEDDYCKICMNKYKKEKNTLDIRSCSNCSKTYCIKCQIKHTITCTFNHGEYTFICPYCTYNYKVTPMSLETFCQNILYRIYRENELKTLNRKDRRELLNFFKKKLAEFMDDNDEFEYGSY